MSGLHRSQVIVAVHRRRGVSAWLLGALLALSFAVPASASAAGITFIAPPGARTYPDQSQGPVGYTEAPVAFRTTDTRPTIAIQADGGTQLQCHFDDVFVTQTCGGPGPDCAAICGSFQPAAPLGPDSDQFSRSHFLAVDLVDADGNSLASAWVNIDVDTTPPVTQPGERGWGAHQRRHERRAAAPDVQLSGDATATRSARRSTPWPAPGVPRRPSCVCPLRRRRGSGSFTPGRLPARHRLYRLQVRGTDDFGRSSTASGVYDPVPCALTVRPPGADREPALVGHRDAVALRRDQARVRRGLRLHGERRSGRHPAGRGERVPVLGEYRASSPTSTFTVSRRLRLSGAARRLCGVRAPSASSSPRAIRTRSAPGSPTTASATRFSPSATDRRGAQAPAARRGEGHIDLSLGLLGPRLAGDMMIASHPTNTRRTDRGHGPQIRPLRRFSQLVELRSEAQGAAFHACLESGRSGGSGSRMSARSRPSVTAGSGCGPVV